MKSTPCSNSPEAPELYTSASGGLNDQSGRGTRGVNASRGKTTTPGRHAHGAPPLASPARILRTSRPRRRHARRLPLATAPPLREVKTGRSRARAELKAVRTGGRSADILVERRGHNQSRYGRSGLAHESGSAALDSGRRRLSPPCAPGARGSRGAACSRSTCRRTATPGPPRRAGRTRLLPRCNTKSYGMASRGLWPARTALHSMPS